MAAVDYFLKIEGIEETPVNEQEIALHREPNNAPGLVAQHTTDYQQNPQVDKTLKRKASSRFVHCATRETFGTCGPGWELDAIDSRKNATRPSQ